MQNFTQEIRAADEPPKNNRRLVITPWLAAPLASEPVPAAVLV